MNRLRWGFLTVSVGVVIAFAGVLFASLGEGDREDLFRSLGILAEVVHLVETEYVDELDSDALALALDAGLMESVDPWAAAVPAEAALEYEALLSEPPPFGLVFASRLGSAAVRHIVPGSPASDVELETWDVIEKIDGIYTRGRPLWQIRLELREAYRAERPVMLTVVDRTIDGRLDIELEPRSWVPDAVTAETRDGTAVVTIHSLPAGTAVEVEQALGAADRAILDLRSLVWGDPEEAIAVADLFAEDIALGEWRGRRAGSETFTAAPGRLSLGQVPVVLVGFETEFVGEILASALRRGGSMLIGQVSTGHAPHMRLVRANGVHLWMPVARWLRDDGEPVDGNGIVPDEEIEAGDASEQQDPILDRALELIRADVELPEAA